MIEFHLTRVAKKIELQKSIWFVPRKEAKMKAFIHIFRDNEEISVSALKTTQVMNLEIAITEFARRAGSNADIRLVRYNDPVALNVSEEFLNKYKKIALNPEGFLKSMSVQFELVNEDNSVCSCFDLYCDHTCGTLGCGCIDVCRCDRHGGW